MTAMPQPQSQRLDQRHIETALISAQEAIHANQFDAATRVYHNLLAQPGLQAKPLAHTEVLANLGALLLHAVRSEPQSPDVEIRLDQAIDLLTQAQGHYRGGKASGSGATTAANLALALYQRFRATARQADLMAAHMALDGAEHAASDDADDLRDWIRSIRDTLLEQMDRRATPRR